MAGSPQPLRHETAMRKDMDMRLIAVDWGTSNLRAYLLDESGSRRDDRTSRRGVGHLCAPQEFAATFNELLAPWLSACSDVPVLISGMAGSAEGWVEAGYVSCPAGAAELAAALTPLTQLAPRRAYVVPGCIGHSVAGQTDVMRGEETQLVGAMKMTGRNDGLWCLPGTHSKWVRTRGGKITELSTFLTGDAYEALRCHTILSKTVEDGGIRLDAFDEGLERSRRGGGLLHHLFSVRSEVLSGERVRDGAGSYLSGLLVGAEIAAILESYPREPIVALVGQPELSRLYLRACRHFERQSHVLDGEQAAIGGLWELAGMAGLLAREE